MRPGSQVQWAKGTAVWLRGGGGGAWRRGTVVGSDARGGVSVALEAAGDGTAAGQVVTVPSASLHPANPSLLDDVSDLTNLTYLNEPSILDVLRKRFAGSDVYTNAGCVLVALNPFRDLPLYGPEVASQYSRRCSSSADAAGPEPHVFLTADRAFKQMLASAQSQSVLITGESGAGKTEATKIMMKYLASLAGGTGMEDKVLESNPVLEAFGNAQTLRNRNSSRFGKLIEIYFNRGHICGALIHTYLLEKSRVVHQQPGERNFHIFYQLCRGASAEERLRYQLPDDGVDGFSLLSMSGCTSIAGLDDAAGFAHVKSALSAVGIAGEQQHAVFSVLSAVLWLGNVRFRALHDDAVTVDEASLPALRRAAGLLACGEQALLAALTTRRMLAGGEQITRELSMEAAVDSRDALSKAIYAALFKWLVQQINAALSVGKQRSETTLSLLDIAGFESFDENSFEQLCINYANERLQQQFSKHMFKLEQDIYTSEGVDWTHVEFVDNQDCVDLFELRPPAGIGIMSLLDEECMMPKGSDATFAAKLQQQHAAHPRFGYNAKAPGLDFTVHHYAGPVEYTARKLLDKNRDSLSRDLVALLQDSTAPLVQALASEMLVSQERKGSQTVGARFRDQLRDLMQRLDATALHFVRCIKPNTQQEADTFDVGLVLHQLRCCGVLEVARIAAQGYPTRYLHADFAARYKKLLPGGVPAGSDTLAVCKQLLEHFSVDPSQYQIGTTRLFFRAGVLGQLEDSVTRMQRSALLIQSTWRMARCRRAFLQARAAATLLQARWRGVLARRAFAAMLRQHRAAMCIQAAARGCLQRRRYWRSLQAVVAIQMAWRRHVVQERVALRLAERRRSEAALQAEMAARRQQEETFEAIQRDFGVDAGEIRRVLGLWQEHGEAFMAWRQQPGALPARTPSAIPTEDSGLLLEIAAHNADSDLMQKRLEGLSVYCRNLEKTVDDLREEKHLLQRALQTVQADPATSAHCQAVLASTLSPSKQPRSSHFVLPTADAAQRAQFGGGRPAYALNADGSATAVGQQVGADEADDRDDASSISLMSLNDDSEQDSFTTGGDTPTAASLAAARNESVAVVTMLTREFDKKRALLLDDAEFIREVRSGEADAPGMQPELELQRLIVRYKVWKKEFRDRLGAAQKVFRSMRKEERKYASSLAGGAAGQHGGPAVQRRLSGTSEQGSKAGSFMSRLKGRGKG